MGSVLQSGPYFYYLVNAMKGVIPSCVAEYMSVLVSVPEVGGGSEVPDMCGGAVCSI